MVNKCTKYAIYTEHVLIQDNFTCTGTLKRTAKSLITVFLVLFFTSFFNDQQIAVKFFEISKKN